VTTESDEVTNPPVDLRVGKSGCVVIKYVNGYGPYAYHVEKVQGRQYWKYLGRADKLGLVTSERVGKSQEVQEWLDRKARLAARRVEG